MRLKIRGIVDFRGPIAPRLVRATDPNRKDGCAYTQVEAIVETPAGRSRPRMAHRRERKPGGLVRFLQGSVYRCRTIDI